MKVAHGLLIFWGVLSPAVSAWADVGRLPVFDSQAGLPALVVQLSPQERRALGEQWGNLSPEERAALRRQFQERWRDIPPEQREIRRREMMDHWRNLPPREREQRQREIPDRDGYGRGYEQRGFEDEPPFMPPVPPFRGGGR